MTFWIGLEEVLPVEVQRTSVCIRELSHMVGKRIAARNLTAPINSTTKCPAPGSTVTVNPSSWHSSNASTAFGSNSNGTTGFETTSTGTASKVAVQNNGIEIDSGSTQPNLTSGQTAGTTSTFGQPPTTGFGQSNNTGSTGFGQPANQSSAAVPLANPQTKQNNDASSDKPFNAWGMFGGKSVSFTANNSRTSSTPMSTINTLAFGGQQQGNFADLDSNSVAASLLTSMNGQQNRAAFGFGSAPQDQPASQPTSNGVGGSSNATGFGATSTQPTKNGTFSGFGASGTFRNNQNSFGSSYNNIGDSSAS
ncbi:hypothetical protein K469DRAFT_689017 [Zopfia rhizophila CBS 207.26]|uniref:Uncharacterized protein n=1 Tax=Zopfia rhizophila CBS 207.26 TaxID=1314779 RepID=A0A6A6ESC9_9PEZI|nr:hypothetical protein K469DRAFT_689017 [Zopfia rhizophila CBS 207.26]